MASKPKNVAMKAIAERLSGDRPGRWRASIGAAVAGTGAAALAYRLLRGELGPTSDE